MLARDLRTLAAEKGGDVRLYLERAARRVALLEALYESCRDELRCRCVGAPSLRCAESPSAAHEETCPLAYTARSYEALLELEVRP